jgi:hypothetical protein
LSRFRKAAEPGRVLVVSEGLMTYGQREVALAVRLRKRESEAEVRARLGELLGAILRFAEQGQLVHEGGFTEFGRPGFLASSTHGVIYANARGLDPEIPDDALVAVLVDTDELRLAQSTCAARVLARLGQVASEYPFPVTCDRERERVSRAGDDEPAHPRSRERPCQS